MSEARVQVSRAGGLPPWPDPLRLLAGVALRQGWRRVQSVREQSKLLSSLIGIFLAGYAAVAFALFHQGLRFAGQFPGLGEVLVERLLYLLFACLFGLLLLSNLVISYTNLFRNREADFLLTMPLPAATVFRWKFIESTVLASWAFLFLVAPLLAAYGLTQHVAWHFYPVTVVFLLLFIVLPAAGGAGLAVALARLLDRRAFQILAVTLLIGLLLTAAFWLRPDKVTDEELETRIIVVLDRLLAKTRFALFPLLPGYWLAAGVQQWAEGAIAGAVFFALVLLSHTLFFGTLLFTRMGRAFQAAISATQSRGSLLARWGWFRTWTQWRRTGRARRGAFEVLAAGLPGVGTDVQALLVKDVRVFWRDTTQWGQTLVLLGLLSVYILNLRHFSAQLTSPFWIQVVSFLNLGACALNLATLTTRFVFPQFSLEGKRFWIIALAPLGLPRLLRAKVALATGLSLIVTLGLLLLSCHLLNLELARTLYLATALAIMTLTLNALAMGLGALYPNLKEDNPSKIVSGFGGTFCLILSFGYVVAAVALVAVGGPWLDGQPGGAAWVFASWAAFLGLSVLAGWVPFRLALRRLATFEA